METGLESKTFQMLFNTIPPDRTIKAGTAGGEVVAGKYVILIPY